MASRQHIDPLTLSDEPNDLIRQVEPVLLRPVMWLIALGHVDIVAVITDQVTLLDTDNLLHVRRRLVPLRQQRAQLHVLVTYIVDEHAAQS